ncbi:H-NS histone family protein [Thiosulfatihalobacter marinus]|jgi:DNA-binding protein H-NS|uniref:H-NS histone family protein n=1 Tax=Thiosulfatihalobacter marinus TaxID=2792481 RepID=UPI0018D6EAA0|nr:H-NS histone family protein [Thiosulfatihalobacter marinus]
MDLKGLTEKELVELKARIDVQLAKLETERRENALKAVKEAAGKFGFSIDEIAQVAGKRRGALVKGLPKYAHPDDASKTWTGKGRKPKWFDEALAAGIAPDQMEI